MNEQALFSPIRRRLVAWAVLVLALIMLLLGSAVYLTLSRGLMDQVDRNLVSSSEQAANVVFAPGRPDPRDGYRGGTFFLALDPGGQVTTNPQRVDVSGIHWPAPGPYGTLATLTLDDEPTRVFAVRAPNGDIVVIGQSLQPVQAATHTLLLVLVAGGGVGLLLSVCGAWFLSGRALVPIQTAFRRQQEFVADASHELRTPLTVLKTSVDVLNAHRHEPLETSGELFDDMRAEIVRMQHLAEDLLTLARSDRGELQLLTAPVNVVDLAAEVVRRAAVLAARRDQRLELDSSIAEANVEVDPDRFQQVLLILLDNAMKYTPEHGRIGVSIHAEPHAVVLRVADTGPGIAPEHLPRLFDRFYRADAARSRSAGGSGLGLSIARMLVEAHRGELSLASSVGVGTVATIRLPLEEAAAAISARPTVAGSPVAP